MDPIGRVVMGGAAVGWLVQLLRALQTGVLYGDEIDYHDEQNPGGFDFSAFIHFGGAVFVEFLVAGYNRRALTVCNGVTEAELERDRFRSRVCY